MSTSIDTRAIQAAAGAALATVLAVYPSAALAYIGPGAGLSLVGSLLALFGAILLAIFGFVFYPVRRMMRRRKEKALQEQALNRQTTATEEGSTHPSQKPPAAGKAPERADEVREARATDPGA